MMFSIPACALRGILGRIRGLNRLKTVENWLKVQHYGTTCGIYSKNSNEIPLYSVRVSGCCSNLYENWYNCGINRRKPLTGLDFDVVYADTMPSASFDVPVIVGLHGTDGSHLTFASLMTHLEQQSSTPVRLVIPNFPGCGYTKCDKGNVFGHGEDERAAFVLDFLKAINVKKVRVMFSHSTGFYAALSLYEQSDHKLVESFGFINPIFLKPLQVVRPIQLNRLLMNRINFPFVQSILLYVATLQNSNVEVKIEEVELNLKYTINVDYEKVLSRLSELGLRRFPVFIAFSNDDPTMKSELSRKLIDILDLNEESILKYDESGSMERGLTAKDRYPKSLIFDKGGHFLTETRPEILVKEILNLSSYVQSKPTLMSSRNDAIYLGN